nr:LytTR family DNA-binding domain-containing protein [Aequitasia blattaphilus]
MGKEYISVNCAGENRNIDIEDIKYFKVDLRVITVYYKKSDSFEFYSTLGKIENMIGAYGFIKIHRSVLVNVAYVKTFTSSEVTLKDGTELPVSRQGVKQLREVFANRTV